ncbi:MAG: hypothetical protein ACJ71G_13130 [Nitrososphaeraceae archaeon]
MGCSTSTEDKREKIQALSLAKGCYSMKLELPTIRFVLNKSKHNERIQDNEKQEEKTEEINQTTNQMFFNYI